MRKSAAFRNGKIWQRVFWCAGKGRTAMRKNGTALHRKGEASVKKKRILLGLISVFKALYNAVYAVMKLRPMQKKRSS